MTDEFARSSSRPAALALALAGVLLAAAPGCVEELPPIEGTQSIRVELVSPTDLGALSDRLPDDERSLVVNLTAVDAQNQDDVGFSGTVNVYVHYLGSLTPPLGDAPLAQVPMTDGVARGVELELPVAYGPSFLWVEDAGGEAPTFATGTSDVLWYRDPYLVDVSRPRSEMALDALDSSPLEEKQINVTASQYGAAGRMVVTGTYAQGYTLSDVQCQDAAGTPPCTTGAYDHVFVFSFSRPQDERGRAIRVGHVIDRLAGGVAEFNGLTEINFPQSFVTDETPRPELVPEPAVIQPSWLDTRIEMERVESALVALEGGTVCPLDDDFATYAQWKLDIGRGCGRPVNIITKGQVSEFDPTGYVGQELPRVVGTLRPVNIGSFHVWIVYPRSMSDLTLP